MNCPDCKHENDPDAVFCTECGKPMGVTQTARKQRKPYLIALLFVPVIVVALGIGYHRYFLPDGIAAVVNGEEIRLSELNAAVNRIPGAGEPGAPRLRQQVLNGMIAERIVLQEALRQGITVTDEEVAAAVAESRTASGMDDKTFNAELRSRYGNMRSYEDEVRRAMISRRFLDERVVPPGASAREAGLAVNQWIQAHSGKASIRVALAEQGGGGPRCGCCNKPGGPKQNAAGAAASDPASQAAAAARDYWRQKHGTEEIETKVTDYGCHMQVDVVKNGSVVGSLRYQNGSISE